MNNRTLSVIALLATTFTPAFAYPAEAPELTDKQKLKLVDLEGVNRIKAIDYLENHIGNAEPTADQLFHLGLNYEAVGRFGKMVTSFEKLQHKSPDGRVLIPVGSGYPGVVADITSSAYSVIMLGYTHIGKYEQAITAGKRAVGDGWDIGGAVNKSNMESIGALGAAYALSGNLTAANKIIQRFRETDALTMANGHSEAASHYTAFINGSLFQIYLASRQFEQALDAFDKSDIPISPAVVKSFSDRWASAELNEMIAYGRAMRGAGRANILMELGRTAEALPLFEAALTHPRVSQAASVYWTALFNRGRIAERAGQTEEAIRFYRRAVDEVEKQRSSIGSDAAKIGFVGDKQMVYGHLINALVRTNQDGVAFEYAERAKARALLDMLASREDQLQARGAEASAALNNVTQLQEELAEAGSRTEQQPGKFQKTRNLMVTATAKLQNTAPELASLVTVSSIDEARLRSLLEPGETLVEYYGVCDDLYAFVATQSGVRAVQLDGKGLSNEVRAFRTALQKSQSRDAGTLAGKLYARLIAPLALPEQGKLLVVPHGVLHYVPFNALATGKDYLLDRYSIRLLPSASVLTFLNQRKPTGNGLLIFGNPDLGDPQLDLPGAQKEAMEIAHLRPGSTLLMRGDATKLAATSQAGKFAYLHFASHGKFNAAQPLQSGLYLANDKATGSSGTLTVDDLYSMNLNADLVTLSACETALGRTVNGDDVIGMTRGFFYAGASSVISSLWAVDDEATYQMMTRFYKELGTSSKADALLKAQREVKAKYPHPFYWAAFQLSGNR